ncbi:MAG: hypothetical protein COB33_011995 [Thiotrichaceae bacterium]|nr:hypothetical protein [Thiotrichaceae bacterium]PCI14381.1 MAG: hypothetical protein COB71_03450 [Thiotrichales bacterium]
MQDNESKQVNIPVLRDVVVPVTTSNTRETSTTPPVAPSLLTSTLQEEINIIINQARVDFEATMAQLQDEIQQRVERELNDLHVQLTSDK